MEFIIEQSIFNQVLNQLAPAVSSRPTHPILSHCLIQVKENVATFTASCLTVFIEQKVEVESVVDGKISIPFVTLRTLVSKLSPQNLHVKLNPETDLITITTSSGQFNFATTDGWEFPAPPAPTADLLTLELEGSQIAKGIELTAFCCSRDDTKQILQGINVQKRAGVLSFAATDSHRLASIDLPIDENIADFAFILPLQISKEIARLCKFVDQVTVQIDRAALVSFQADNLKFTVRCLAGDYPNYKAIIPDTYEHQITCSKKDLLPKIDIVKIISDGKFNSLIEFNIENGQITLVAKDEGNLARETLNTDYIGEVFRLGFNSKYLLEGFKTIPGDKLIMKTNGAAKPVVFVTEELTDFIFLVMPVTLAT